MNVRVRVVRRFQIADERLAEQPRAFSEAARIEFRENLELE